MAREFQHTHCKACGKPLTNEQRRPEASCCNRKCASKWSHMVRTKASYKKAGITISENYWRKMKPEEPFYVTVPEGLEQESMF